MNNNFINNNHTNKEPIAVVGIGCRFPGNVNNYNDFVKVVKSGKDCLTKIPSDRWNADVISRKQPKLNNRIGGFIENIDKFDNQFFSISPKEAQNTDPQQRLLLHIVIEALEDAKISLDQIKGNKIGVFIGSSSSDYLRGFDSSEINQFSTPGTNSSFLSNRLSYFLDVNGPSITVNTACAASMTAVHLGLTSIWNGETKCSIVGGVNIISSPLQSLDYGKAGLLNTEIDGRCYSFDPRASGYVRAEGGGILVLKPLSQAIEDKDEIYSLFLNSGNNSNGKTPSGITSPRASCQESLIGSLIKESNIDFNKIGYFECHGTGTEMGDSNEMSAIGNSIGLNKSSPLIIGSVKSGIGHLEGASGICGIIKTIACIKEKFLPPQCKFSGYNPKIPFEQLNLKVLTSCQEWNDIERIAGVNSFGVGGSNANVFLSSFEPNNYIDSTSFSPLSNSTTPLFSSSSSPLLSSTSSTLTTFESESDTSSNITPRPNESINTFDIVTLSVTSQDKNDLKDRVNDVLNEITKLEESNSSKDFFKNICYSTTNRVSHFSNRLVILASDLNDFKVKAKSFLNDQIDPSNKSTIYHSENYQKMDKKKLGFIFSGQGQQWNLMGNDLYLNNKTFKREMNKFSSLFQAVSGWSIVEKLYEKPVSVDTIHETWLAQPSIAAVQYSLSIVLRELGIEPSLTIGHSLGEMPAAYFAGVISLEDMVKLLWLRSHLQNKTSGTGRMEVIISSREDVESLIFKHGFFGKISICGNNSAKGCAVAGDNHSMDEFSTVLTKENLVHREIRTNAAFHSYLMDPIKEEFYKLFPSDIETKESLIPFYSTTYGRFFTSTECKEILLSPDYWWKNIREAVLFKESMDSILKNNVVNGFVEISSHPIVSYFTNQLIKSNNSKVLLFQTLSKDTNPMDCIVTLLSKLYISGIDIKWETLYEPRHYCAIKLPPRKWRLDSFWMENNQKKIDRINPPKFSSLEKRLFSVTPSFEVRLNQERFKYLNDHKIQGIPIVPFAFFVELVYSSIADLQVNQSFEIKDFEITSAITIDSKMSNIIGVNFNSDATMFEIGSVQSTLPTQKWNIHARGTIIYGSDYLKSSKFNYSKLSSIQGVKSFNNSDEFYNEILEYQYEYGPSFRSLKKATLIDENTQYSYLELNKCKELSTHLSCDFRGIHPSLFDAILQSAFIPACNKEKGLWLPTKIGSYSLNLPSLENQFIDINSPLHCLSKVNSFPTFNSFSTSVQIFDSNGIIIAEIKDLQMKLVSKVNHTSNKTTTIEKSHSNLKNENESQAISILSEYQWNKDEISISTPIKYTDSYQTIIFCSTNLNNNPLLDSTIKSLIDNGHDEDKIFIVSPPPNENDQYNNRIIINYTDNESDYDGLFAIINNKGLSITNFILLPNFYTSSSETQSKEFDNYDNQKDPETLLLFKRSNISILNLEKSIIKNNLKGRFFLITEGAQSVFQETNNEKINLDQYQTIGLARVFSNEYPLMECSMIDIEKDTDCNLVTQQINSTQLYKWEVAYRKNQVYSYKLTSIHGNKNQSKNTIDRSNNYYRVELSDKGVISDLVIKQVKQLTCKPNQVQVRVKYCSLNFRDILKSLGRDYDSIHLSTMGDEFSGIVTEIGNEVTHLKVGQRVFGINMSRSMGSFVTCDADLVFPISNLTEEGACTIPIVFLTSWYSLVVQGRLKKNEKVLIHSACGGVGLASIQIAQYIGAEIFATVGSNDKKEYLVKNFGIDPSKIYSSRSLNFYNEIMNSTSGEGVDVVLNSLSGEYLEKSIQTLSNYGRFVEIGKKDIYSNSKIGLLPFRNNLSFLAVDIAQMTENKRSFLAEMMINDILPLFKQGLLKALDQTIFENYNIVKAIRFMSAGNHIGKILINWDDMINEKLKTIDFSNQMFKANATYIFTGTGGLTQILLKDFAVNSEIKNVVLVSINGISNHPNKVKLINQLEENNVNVIVEKCDLVSSHNVEKLFSKLINEYPQLPPIKGIFHFASLVSDRKIPNHTNDSFLPMYNSKALSAWNLHNQSLIHNLELDHFVTVGSLVTVLGNIGLSNYCAANKFVEGLTNLRYSMGLNATCIHLTSIPEVGMASNDRVINLLKSIGVMPYENLSILVSGINYIMKTNTRSIKIFGEAIMDRFIKSVKVYRGKECFEELNIETAKDNKEISFSSFDNDNMGDLPEDEDINNESQEEIDGDEEYIISKLRNIVCDIIEIRQEDLINNVSFNNYGIDSLLSSELSNSIQKIFNVLIPSLTLVDNSNIQTAAGLIKSKLESSNISLNKKKNKMEPKKNNNQSKDSIKKVISKIQEKEFINQNLIPNKSPSSKNDIKPLILDSIQDKLKLSSKELMTSPPPSAKRENKTETSVPSQSHILSLNNQQQHDFSDPNSLATVLYEISPVAAPHHRYQKDVLNEILELTEEKEFISNIYDKCKINSRYCFNNQLTMAELNEIDAGQRVKIFKEATYQTVVKAGESVIKKAGIDPLLISHVVGVTSTGIMAPSIDVILIDRLGLSKNTSRTMINFMGCGASINSMRAASAYARSRPGTFVLVVAVESSSTCMKFDFGKRSDLISQCIFTDGCVGTLITCQPRLTMKNKMEIIDDMSYLMPDSRDALTLFMSSSGLDLDLRPELPLAINRYIKQAFDEFLDKNQLELKDLEFFATHPGGVKIISAVHEGLGLSPEDLSDSYEVMKRYGNMVGVSTYYVLRRILDKNNALLEEGSIGYKYGIALAFSPGASIEAVLFKLVE
ncbi:hypothetical protein DICPUDRAFT_159351 [Dictyostelium purpureum]|uniref:Uncharacterized protein n=1 Tax=Dictyostelium purpureum TaxID=5786 RepID=F1A3W7_DICPU|nr:uncharacterized protein DICPUDRAFT_159351 [Dictyostelium purpureum]EGC29114.1 hypothetical protein DICPUDRAFT_159351 [Dictyostelium purpureum]|eukprot:XP_003294361.1 hypothetical protein DICPUDRAFT_159351 [Dictyostelium purpureum]